MGAGHLKAGDRLKLADGSLGTMLNVTTVQQTREMFNLTVDEAHTFYVGTQGWLVHNGGIIGCERIVHTLYGDAYINPQQIPGVGGHLYPGAPGKTPFPANWTEKDIIGHIEDILTSPSTQWYAQTGPGGAAATAMRTSNGNPANWISWETRGGVLFRVVYQPAANRLVTAFPETNTVPASILAKPIR